MSNGLQMLKMLCLAVIKAKRTLPLEEKQRELI
jgi:hypothetical protein